MEAMIMRDRNYCNFQEFLFIAETLCPLGEVEWSPLSGNFVMGVF